MLVQESILCLVLFLLGLVLRIFSGKRQSSQKLPQKQLGVGGVGWRGGFSKLTRLPRLAGAVMSKFKNRELAVCANRHCSKEFRPQRENQRFCSETCRKDSHYALNRSSKKPRKRALKSVENFPGSGIPGSVEKHEKSDGETASCKGHVTLAKRCGIEVPTTTDIDDDELRQIIRLERG